MQAPLAVEMQPSLFCSPAGLWVQQHKQAPQSLCGLQVAAMQVHLLTLATTVLM